MGGSFLIFFTVLAAALQHCPTGLVIPGGVITEPCPPDSVHIEGVCKCDHTLCTKPACAYQLAIATNYTHVPGECCPTYTCHGCPEDVKINGSCPCLPGAILTTTGKCECTDPYQSIVNGSCVCDRGKCKLPNLCNERSVPVKDLDGCCETIECVTCPDDSYPTSYNDQGLDEKCVCFPCPDSKCSQGQAARILRRGKTVPGQCCDIYTCEPEGEATKGCFHDGLIYSEGDTWTVSSGDKCKCQNGISLCTPSTERHPLESRPCLYGGKIYHHLQAWIEDVCTNCTCTDGTPKCIAHLCEVHPVAVDLPAIHDVSENPDISEMPDIPPLCPSMEGCRKICDKGYKVNRQGCEVCKCRGSDKTMAKFHQLDVLLKKHNMTEEDLVRLINRYEKTDDNALEHAEADDTSVDCTNGGGSISSNYIVPMYVIGALLVITALLILLVFWCTSKYKQKHIDKNKNELQQLFTKNNNNK